MVVVCVDITNYSIKHFMAFPFIMLDTNISMFPVFNGLFSLQFPCRLILSFISVVGTFVFYEVC